MHGLWASRTFANVGAADAEQQWVQVETEGEEHL